MGAYREEGKQSGQRKTARMDVHPQHRLTLASMDMRGRWETEEGILGGRGH